MTSIEPSPAPLAEAHPSVAVGEASSGPATPLRRIAHHLRNQHWIAIGIEFLVVVFGVFLGFQLTSWNETRQQADIERAMLVRLGEEFRLVEVDLAGAVKSFDATVRSTRQIIETLRTGAPPEDDAAFRIALRDAQYIWDAPALSTTYQELVAIGGLSRLHDPDLRKSLARYSDYSERYARKMPNAVAAILAPDSSFLKAVAWSANVDDWAGPDAVVSYDWTALQDAEAELQSWLSYQSELGNYSREQLMEIRSVLSRLDKVES
ncbi:MAG: hypothetical protein Q8R82_09030 [Hyphomonadaceae bacterium]|nr:hypothetical protein [Hyphomonadaceae bacterium]